MVLILLNIFSIGLFWWERRDRHRVNEPVSSRMKDNSAMILKEKLGLNENQAEALVRLRENYFLKEEQITAIIRSQRDSMNAIMFHPGGDTTILKGIASRVAANEYQIEVLRIEQASKLKVICTEEQLLKFQNIIKEIRDYFQPKKKKE